MRISLLFMLLLAIASCKKNKPVPPEPLPALEQPASQNNLDIRLKNTVNGSALVLGATQYTTASSDTFSVSVFKYYFTNVALITGSGQAVTIPATYFLADQSDTSSLVLHLNNVPEGDYHQISFLIGVDSERNTSGAQTGALDPVKGMFWDWNSGYIMAKMEGASPQSGNALKTLSFHIGGYSGRSAGTRSVQLSLPTDLHIHAGRKPIMTIAADLALWFTGAHTIRFATVNAISTVSSSSSAIADNYANMFTVTSVIN